MNNEEAERKGSLMHLLVVVTTGERRKAALILIDIMQTRIRARVDVRDTMNIF